MRTHCSVSRAQQFSKANAHGRGQPFAGSSPQAGNSFCPSSLWMHLEPAREGGVHSCLHPLPPKRLSDIGRVCDLSEEEPAAYLPCPSANTQPLQVQKDAAVRQTPRGLWLQKHIWKARQKGREIGNLGSARQRYGQAREESR